MDSDTIKNARHLMKGFCRVCPYCDGKACAGEVPGMGGTGTGSSFFENIKALERVKLEIRTLHSHRSPDTSVAFLGRRLSMPVMGAPIGGVKFNISEKITERYFVQSMVLGAHRAGTLAGTGDGELPEIFDSAMEVLDQKGGEYGDEETGSCVGIPFIKPWEEKAALLKLAKIRERGCEVFGMDIDAAGLITLKELGLFVYPKSPEELRKIAEASGMKMILKGIMTPDQARLAVDAGASAIVVSNHGGRVLDHTPGTAAVLPSIAAAVGGDVEILVDGGIRSGVDVFKMLALGAQAVLVGRPMAIAAVGGGTDAVEAEYRRFRSQLEEVMLMTDCPAVDSIDPSRLHGFSSEV